MSEWQCRHVFPDRFCCGLPIGHDGEHQRVTDTDEYRLRWHSAASDILAWLNDEQKKPERWTRPPSGVNRFMLTLPELMRIRRALEG